MQSTNSLQHINELMFCAHPISGHHLVLMNKWKKLGIFIGRSSKKETLSQQGEEFSNMSTRPTHLHPKGYHQDCNRQRK